MVGIRPEDISLVEPAENGTKILLNVEVFEPMGNETNIYFTTGKTPIVCRTPDFNPDVEVQDTIPVYLNREKMHFFDPESGLTIRRNLSD